MNIKKNNKNKNIKVSNIKDGVAWHGMASF